MAIARAFALESRASPEAEPLLRECLAIREKTQPDDWQTFDAQSLLGGALLGQKKYAEAEPLLLPGIRGHEAAGEGDPRWAATRIPEALDRLIELVHRDEPAGRSQEMAGRAGEVSCRSAPKGGK